MSQIIKNYTCIMEDNLPTRIKYWLKDAKHDCFFVVGPKNGQTEKIGAVKTLLMGDSEPLRAMLQDSEMAEKKDIRIIDIEPETFSYFLKCAYGGGSIIMPKLSFEQCAKLLYVAEKYLVNDVINEVSERLNSLFSFDNFFIAVSHPVCYNSETLNKQMVKVLKHDMDKIMKDDRFLELNEATIKWILELDYLTVKEIDIWNAVLRWAKHRENSSEGKNLRKRVFPFLKNFRFLAMDYVDFWESVVFSEILMKEEVYEICKSFGTGKPHKVKHLCKNKYNRYDLGPVSEKITSTFTGSPKYCFIHCLVKGISELNLGLWYSKSYQWDVNTWNVQLQKSKKDDKDYIKVFVGCKGKTPISFCSVNVETSLLNQKGKRDVSIKSIYEYSESRTVLGIALYPWDALLNTYNGFVKDNSVIFTVQVKNQDA